MWAWFECKSSHFVVSASRAESVFQHDCLLLLLSTASLIFFKNSRVTQRKVPQSALPCLVRAPVLSGLQTVTAVEGLCVILLCLCGLCWDMTVDRCVRADSKRQYTPQCDVPLYIQL